MILTIGMDLVDVDRIARAMENPRFLERILTPRERELELTVGRIAGRWAAKEAVAKAVGLHLAWHHVEILNEANGRPYAVVHDPAFDSTTQRLHVTITHERGHAAAVAILEAI